MRLDYTYETDDLSFDLLLNVAITRGCKQTFDHPAESAEVEFRVTDVFAIRMVLRNPDSGQAANEVQLHTHGIVGPRFVKRWLQSQLETHCSEEIERLALDWEWLPLVEA